MAVATKAMHRHMLSGRRQLYATSQCTMQTWNLFSGQAIASGLAPSHGVVRYERGVLRLTPAFKSGKFTCDAWFNLILSRSSPPSTSGLCHRYRHVTFHHPPRSGSHAPLHDVSRACLCTRHNLDQEDRVLLVYTGDASLQISGSSTLQIWLRVCRPAQLSIEITVRSEWVLSGSGKPFRGTL